MGAFTVELVAVNAVMADAKPDYMPLLITAMEAFLEPKSNWRGSLATAGKPKRFHGDWNYTT